MPIPRVPPAPAFSPLHDRVHERNPTSDRPSRSHSRRRAFLREPPSRRRLRGLRGRSRVANARRADYSEITGDVAGKVAGHQLVTTDKAFKQFKGLDLL